MVGNGGIATELGKEKQSIVIGRLAGVAFKYSSTVQVLDLDTRVALKLPFLNVLVFIFVHNRVD